MRLNAKIFSMADGKTPAETQEFDNRLVEVYYINDFPELFNQYLPKGKFAIWSSMDGFNYRLFVEKGYFEEIGELYTDKVNKVWLDFWDKCDDLTKKYNYRIMLPVAILCLVLFFVVSAIPMGSAGMWVQIGLLLVFIVAMMMINKFVKKKINEVNAQSVDDIKKIVGSKHFEELLDGQKVYMDKFFEEQARLAEEEERKEQEASDENHSDELVENNLENEENKDSSQETSEDVTPVEEVNAEVVENTTEATALASEVSEATEENKNN